MISTLHPDVIADQRPARCRRHDPAQSFASVRTWLGRSRSVAMVRVYTRRADAFPDHAGEGLL